MATPRGRGARQSRMQSRKASSPGASQAGGPAEHLPPGAEHLPDGSIKTSDGRVFDLDHQVDYVGAQDPL